MHLINILPCYLAKVSGSTSEEAVIPKEVIGPSHWSTEGQIHWWNKPMKVQQERFFISPTQHGKQTKICTKNLGGILASKQNSGHLCYFPPSTIQLPKRNTKSEAQGKWLSLGARGRLGFLECPPWGVSLFPTGFLMGAAPCTATAVGAFFPLSMSLLSH